MHTILRRIRKELECNIDPRTKATGQKYFKEKVEVYGVKVAALLDPAMPRN